MQDEGNNTLYDIVVMDRATGKSRVVAEAGPVSSRRAAEETAIKMERAERNPNLHYKVERSRRKPVTDGNFPMEALLTHKFHVC